MFKTLIAASLMAVALTACNKANDNPSATGSSSATPPAGLSQLGGAPKK
jgi:hypothetical protein